MKAPAILPLLLVVLVAAGAGLFFVLGDAGDGSGDSAVPSPLAGATAEQRALRDELQATQWLVDSDYAAEGLLERLAAQKVSLTVAERAAVLPLVAAHLKTLRANLEAAHAAAGPDTPVAQRTRYTVAAAKAHGEFQRALQGLVSPERAKALYAALPKMLPPMPAPQPQ